MYGVSAFNSVNWIIPTALRTCFPLYEHRSIYVHKSNIKFKHWLYLIVNNGKGGEILVKVSVLKK